MKRSARARGSRQGGRGAPPPSTPAEVTIDALGARGDGVATLDGIPLFVPSVVPGDRVQVQPTERCGDGFLARLLEIGSPGPARVQPPCPYFGDCGGCALQHMAVDAAREWKRQRVVEALARLGLGSITVDPAAAIPVATEDPAGGRRRAVFVATRKGGSVRVGFNARGSHRAVDVARYLILTDTLNGLLDPLRRLFGELLADGERAQAVATDLCPGLDVVLVLPDAPGLQGRERLARFAAERRVTRLSWRRKASGPVEPLAQSGPCQINFAGIAVDFPPAGFLQPNLAGETHLQDIVVAGVGHAKSVADLYAGLGTFTFSLAQGGRQVHAVEMDESLAGALARASHRAGIAGRVTVEARNLDRRPLTGAGLARFAAAVFDPPRPGAPAQSRALAAAENLTRVVAVSCNPATFARDARILVQGGFRADRIIPVDQFAYSPHLEVVGWFSRDSAP